MSTTRIPGGKSAVTPYVVARGAARFLDFVERTFQTAPSMRVENPDGTIGHGEVVVDGAVIMVFDTQPGWPETPSFLSVYVDDVDAVFARALAAGATVVTDVVVSGIIGDRGGRLRDPVGNVWWIQTHLEDVDHATMLERFQDPEELATMRRLQQSFDDEMRSRSGVTPSD